MSTPKYYAFEGKEATINGVTKSWADWCAERGITRRTVYFRMRKGMTFEEAIARKSMRGKAFWESEITKNGETRTAVEWMRHYGISRQCWNQRVFVRGMTEAEAATTPLMKGGKILEIESYEDLDRYMGSRAAENELSLNPTPEIVEMCTHCKRPDCNSTIVKCLRDKRRKEQTKNGAV